MALRSVDRDPDPVTFPSADGKTLLIGYLWRPVEKKRAPAVVMLHGRSGAYSSSAKTIFSARFLSKRHLMWGDFWAEHGYVALLVDSFGPRGYVGGFDENTIDERPPDVSEKDVRPLDAYGAAAWLRTLYEVRDERIGLQGWSNGAMATLWAMSDKMPKRLRIAPKDGFSVAIALYPGCSRIAQEQPDYRPYAPLLMLLAGDDEEVSPDSCEAFGRKVQKNNGVGGLETHTYPGARHSFDHPDSGGAANTQARSDAIKRALELFGKYL